MSLSQELSTNPNYSYDQIQKLKRSEEYIKKHNLMRLFNELTSKLVVEKPDDVRGFLAQEIREIRKSQNALFLQQSDFEAIYENYNILNLNSATFENLVQAIQRIGSNLVEQEIINKYKLSKNQKFQKNQFVQILSDEYYQLSNFTKQ